MDAPGASADDSALLEGRACYTTALVEAGSARWLERHVSRLQRDARLIGIGEVSGNAIRSAFSELGRAVFETRRGVVRVQASRDGAGGTHLLAVAREIGPERGSWTAISVPFHHPGPMPWAGAKTGNHLFYSLARDRARKAGTDEAILFDAADRLVEGTRCNLIVALADGALVTPDLARGAVAGVTLELLRERISELRDADISRRDLSRALELIAINAVRGARPIVEVDGTPVGTGEPGRWAGELADALRDG